jgi:hypothetical protein
MKIEDSGNAKIVTLITCRVLYSMNPFLYNTEIGLYN